MKTLLSLLMESSLALAMLYGVYWLFLRKETFYRLNRYYLISALIVSVLLPLVPVHYATTAVPVSGMVNLKAIAADSGNSKFHAGGFSSEEMALLFFSVIYFTGVILLLTRLLFQSGRLFSILRRSESFRTNNVHIVKSQRYNIPFSFFNFVFYNPENHNQEELAQILVHEKVHIRERHWIDLLVAELWSVVFWFNPFVWLFERSIRQNHEYLADSGVLAQGHTVGRYQALLINQLMGSPVVALANHLNFSLNTTRFKMMTKKETPKIRVMRIGWVLPVLALLLWAFAEPDFKSRTEAGFDGKGSQPLTVTNPSDIKVSGTIVDPEGKPLPGASVIMSGTTVGTVTDVDGNFELLIPGNQSITLVFSFVGYTTKIVKIDSSDKDIKLKTNKMKEAVVAIGKLNDNFVPPPPPPPATDNGNTQKIKEESSVAGKETLIIVEEMPMFPGGEKALQQYVTEMEQKLAQAKNIRGKAVVEFTVNGEGKAVNPVIRQQDNESAGAGAVAIINNMQPWTPGKQQGKPVPVKYVMPVEF